MKLTLIINILRILTYDVTKIQPKLAAPLSVNNVFDLEKFIGKVYVFGNNIDTNQIYPGKYVEYTEIEDIKKFAMSGSEIPNLAEIFNIGDIIVGGTNFGCGSSREHAVMTLKRIGVGAILAESFARIFYRNAINLGVPALTCKDIDKI